MSRKTRNLIWSVPLVVTLAIVGALTLFLTLAPNDASAQTEEEVPGVPLNLMVEGISATSIELMWDPPMDGDGGSPDSYRIDFSPDGKVWHSLNPTYDSTLYTDDANLSAIEQRYYRVFAVNSTGSSDVLGPVMGTTLRSTVPEAIEDLMASVGANPSKTPPVLASENPVPPDVAPDAPQNSIRLQWTAPDDPDGAPVISYRILESKNGRSYGHLETVLANKRCVEGVCTYIRRDLLESTNRWYRVYPTNKMGEGEASEDAPQGSTALGITPGAVAAVRAGLNPAGEIFLYWDPPVDDTAAAGNQADPEGAPLLGYYIQGERGVSGEEVAVTPGDTPSPSKAKLVYVGANTDVPITDALQKKLATKGNTGTHWSFRVIASNRVVDRNLLDGTLDLTATLPEATVHADTSVLEFHAAPDNEDSAVPADDLLDAPTLTVSRDTNLVGGRISLILEWRVRDAAPDVDNPPTYRIEHSEDLVDWELVVESTEVTADPGVTTDDYQYVPEFRAADAAPDVPHRGKHINLVAGTNHHYRVFATHPRTIPVLAPGVFTEASRDVQKATTDADKPDPPALDDPIGSTETVIKMTWTPPVVADGDDGTMSDAGLEPVGYGRITGYQVESSADGTTWTDLVQVGPRLDRIYTYNNETGKLTDRAEGAAGDDGKVDFEHTKLYQDQTVHYRVSTINNARPRVQISDTSFARSATTKKALASDDPGGLVVKARGSSMIQVMWNARADDIQAAPVSGYRIDSSPLDAGGDCAETWTMLVEDTMSTATSYTHMGLSPGTGQCYRIFGINVVATSTSFVGYGDAYVTTNDNDAIATTFEAANTAPTAGAAIADQTVMVDATVMVQSTITDADTDDTLTWSAMSNMPAYATAMVDDMGMVTITGVAEGMATITVTATDIADATATQEIMVTVEAAEPEEVGPATGVTTGPFNEGGVIQVNWDPAPNAVGYIIYAVNVDELDDPDGQIVIAAVNDATAETYTLSGLKSGDTYDIYVVATAKEMVAWPASADVKQVAAE